MPKEFKLRAGDPIMVGYIDRIGDLGEGVVCEVLDNGYYVFAYCDKRKGQVELGQIRFAGTEYTFMPYFPTLEALERFQPYIEKVRKNCHRTYRRERPPVRKKKPRGR